MSPSDLSDLLVVLRAHAVTRYEYRSDGSYTIDLASTVATDAPTAGAAPESEGIDPLDAIAAARAGSTR